jgi:hypothetical protein
MFVRGVESEGPWAPIIGVEGRRQEFIIDKAQAAFAGRELKLRPVTIYIILAS